VRSVVGLRIVDEFDGTVICARRRHSGGRGFGRGSCCSGADAHELADRRADVHELR
jgi:hypothetical protein